MGLCELSLLCRRVADPAAAALRQQLDLQLSTAAGTSRAQTAQQQQQQQADGHPLSVILPGVAARAAAASGAPLAVRQQVIQPGQPAQPMQVVPPGPCTISWGRDRRKDKSEKQKAELQQKAEEREAKRAAHEQWKEEQRQLKAQQKAEKEAVRKAAEAEKRAAAKKERVRLKARKPVSFGATC